MSDKTTTREKALIWWNNLPFNSNNTEKGKVNYTFKYYGLDRKYTSLTGKEIEEIYLKEIASNPSTDVLENTPFHKPDFSHLKVQTAVDWFANEIDNLLPYVNEKTAKQFNDLVEKAKAIQQEQMENAFDAGVSSVLKNFDKAYSDINGEEWYRYNHKE